MAAKVKMCLVQYYFLVFFTLFFHCHALNCRTDTGPKEDELKNIYITCLKRQDGKNSSTRGHNKEDPWKSAQNQPSPWDRIGNGRDDRMASGRDDNMSNRDSYDRSGGRDRMGNSNDRSSGRNSRYDGMSSADRMGQRDNMGSGSERVSGRSDMMGTGYNGEVNGRDDFPQSDEFGSFSNGQMAQYDPHRSSSQPSRRFKREKRMEMNSGQRSQYNPNISKRPPNREDISNNEEGSSDENTSDKGKDMDKKACALHCFLENLEMVGDNGMPDKYLVTHAITKDVKNEDLRDFLQESIEECFQILDNENTEDKCKFSKDLLMCLSEKGRANCDDWKDDIQF